MFLAIDDNLTINTAYILYLELKDTIVFIKYLNNTCTELESESVEAAEGLFTMINTFLFKLGENK